MENLKKQAETMRSNAEQYGEFKEKEKSNEEVKKTGKELMDIFNEIGSLKHLSPEHEDVQAKIKELQDCSTGKHFTCTNTILLQLGKIYTAGAFKNNIDKAGGEGTAEFTYKAIQVYCKKQGEDIC